MARSVLGPDTDAGGNNIVLLTGRFSGEPVVRQLPSGQTLVSWRLVVDRPTGGQATSGLRLPTVDTIACVTFKRGVQRVAERWVAGDVLAVRGSLRRRFWRGPHGPASRYEVEVFEVRKVVRFAR